MTMSLEQSFREKGPLRLIYTTMRFRDHYNDGWEANKKQNEHQYFHSSGNQDLLHMNEDVYEQGCL